MKASDVMVSDVITVHADDTVQKAAKVLLDHRISGVPVVDPAGHLVGMLSEGDLMRRSEIGTEKRASWWLKLFSIPDIEARDFVKAHALKVADVMTRQVVTASESHTLGEVASLLEKHGIKRVPIVRDGTVIGIVSRANLLQAFASTSVVPDQETRADDQTTRERVIEQIKISALGHAMAPYGDGPRRRGRALGPDSLRGTAAGSSCGRGMRSGREGGQREFLPAARDRRVGGSTWNAASHRLMHQGALDECRSRLDPPQGRGGGCAIPL